VPASVIIYTTDVCPYCVRAKKLLSQKGVAYDEVNVEEKPEIRSWLVSASGQRTVPQVFINGVSIGGFSELADLDRSGRLQGLLEQVPPADAPPLPR
jgi:glutaredoxin 3